MSSPSSSPSFILPDSPPAHQCILNYWQRKAALAADSSAPAPVPSPLSVEPPSPGQLHQCLAPAATWAPQRAVLATLSNKIKQKQGKRKLTFEEAEVSGEEDEETIYSQTKKRAGMEDNSSMVPLLEEVRRVGDELDFVQLINQPVAEPWIPLRELKEHIPYPIIAAREQTNMHGRWVILKISNAGSKSVSEVYLPQRFASCISTEKIEQFNANCKNFVMMVTHKSGNWTDIRIVKHQQFLYLYNSSTFVILIV
ncbi:uncharacterized protein LOC120352196 [Nilaparvata lugens]|uniref:uncharacterized protein LOC120352196 n=1 Tax=Nilaparvata lugens TaxID=108931 RepID=UPI00193E8524|nr:uncharacterized protein LOC120352196 [Nilaparvata lugens]